MKIKQIHFNWRQVGSTQDRDGAGEDYEKYEVGIRNVIEIEEFLAPKWGNLTSYVVHFEDGRAVRVFNPNYVEYFPFEEEG